MSDEVLAIPASFAQQRLWFLDQLVPGNPFYNIFSSLPLKLVKVTTLEKALNEIVKRHETLRTTFAVNDGQPVQIIAEDVHLTIPVIDLSSYPETQIQSEIQRLADEEARRPFNLERGPLVRATLLRYTDSDYVLLLTMHHIISDGWSIGLLFQELTSLYQSCLVGQPSQLQELPIQYADFALWQRNWLSGDVLDRQIEYWSKQLNDVPVLQLATDRPRPALMSYKGARLPVSLPPELVEQIRALSQREGVTLFMTLLAAFQVLLYRYTGQEDIAVGSPIAGRNRAEIEGLIGFFVNTLVMRTDLSGDPPFNDLLHRVHEVATGAYAHQDLPFEMLVEQVLPERDLGRNPLFQVIFQLLNAPTIQQSSSVEAVSTEMMPADVHSGTAKFDLEFSLFENAQALVGHFEYSTDLFDVTTIERMAHHYHVLLESIVTNPQTCISELQYLRNEEIHQLVVEWNQTHSNYPKDKSVHQLFEEQVRLNPTAVAIIEENEEVSYEALNQRANQLAFHIQSLGVGPAVNVGICMERSASMVVALLGVLKAGGTYVPLDPEYPKNRLGFMLEDTRISVLITMQYLQPCLPEHTAQLVCLDAVTDVLTQLPTHNPVNAVSPSDLAYIMYTSGSTGTPKGACIPHRAINRLVLNTNYIDLEASDRIAHISNTSFDAATFELWGALLNGARLVVLRKETALSPEAFANQIREQQLSVLFVTTSLFNKLVSEVPTIFSPLRYLLFGGSAVDPKWVGRVLTHGAPDHLLHVYGPTENTTFSTYYPVNAVAEGATTVPIGYPISSSQVYILDKHHQVVPIGVPGELYVGGDGLADGYLNQPELTAQSFVSNPFVRDDGARLYKTGDLVRFHADGSIEFLGRIDDQIKLRGFRVELGEIEAVLSQHVSVKEAVVVANKNEFDDTRLVAYVVPSGSGMESEVREATPQLFEDQVSSWKSIFDDHVYRQFNERDDVTFNITGWNSVYTGLPIPDMEMREWLDDTVRTVMDLKPDHVLEIGCGTGLILFSVAPQCDHYFGTDISNVALDYIRQQFANPENALPQVRLRQQPAHDFSGIEAESYDLVILNSVVQYFPNLDYLRSVLEGAVRSLRPGGHIMIGDVRSFPQLEMLHTSVQLSKAGPGDTKLQLRERVLMQVEHETELAVDPLFFTDLLKHQFPEISHVSVFPKQGGAHNELTKFRYQVIISVGSKTADTVMPEWIDWEKNPQPIAEIRNELILKQPDLLGIKNITNGRLCDEISMVEAVQSDDSPSSVGELLEYIGEQKRLAVDPQDLWALQNELPYRVTISCAHQGREGRFDVVFSRFVENPSNRHIPEHIVFEHGPVLDSAGYEYANNPLRRESARNLIPRLRAHLQDQLPGFMTPASFVVIDSLPLTPNGKVNVQALPPPDGERPEMEQAYTAPRNDVEHILVEIWSEVLGLDKVGVHDNFFDLGGDSILSIQIIARAKQMGVQLTPQQVFQHQNISELAMVAREIVRADTEQGTLTGDLPLLPVQEWFFQQKIEDPHHFNQSILIPISPATDIKVMREAVIYLIGHHDALRLRFVNENAEWKQYYEAEPEKDIFEEIDLTDIRPESQMEALEKKATELQASLDLSDGPLLRVAYFHLSDEDRLLFIIHHLAVDGVSWRILMEDLQTAYTQLTEDETVTLPAKTTSYRRWAQRLKQYSESAMMQQELSYWLQAPRHVNPIPEDYRKGGNTVATARDIEVALTVEETGALLKDVPATYRTHINEVLLTALVNALSRWTGSTSQLLDMEGHGREDLFEDVDLTRTVGWFTSIFPVWLTLGMDASHGDALKSIKEQFRRIPNRGVGYGILRYLSEDETIRQKLADLPQAQISFNYLGQFSSDSGNGEDLDTDSISPTESSGVTRSPHGHRPYLLEINGRVEQGQLRLCWTYSENYHKHDTISMVANDFIASLQLLIRHCQAAEPSGYTPEDFPSVALSQHELDSLLAELSEDG